jgi:ABC-type transport system involved in multi-copper enzyme maturation permease subunit
MSKVLAIGRFTLLEAVRTRLLWLVLAALGGLLLASVFVQQLAIAESARVQTGFLASGTRLAMVFVLCLYVASSMAREFNDKGVELLLSLDLPRAGYYLGKLAGYAGLALVVAVAATATLAIPGLVTKTMAMAGLALHSSPLPSALPLWGMSLACELLLVASLTLFCTLTFAQIMPAVTFVAAFYMLARSIGAIRLIAGSDLLPHHDLTQRALGWMVDAMALILPDLGRFTSTAWLVNGSDGLPAAGYVLGQTAIYGVLVTLAGLFDLYRKNL